MKNSIIVEEIPLSCFCSKSLANLETWADVKQRIALAPELQHSLKQLYFSHQSSTAVWQCEVCGTHLGDARPFAEHHGAGPLCFFAISWETRHEDMDRESKNIHILRQKYEESVFVNSLGPEVGPSVCKSPACKRLTVKLSVKCREHHFLMIRGYAIGSHL